MSEDLLGVARAWSRPKMSRALLDALAVLESDREREHTAWLLKRTLAVEHAAEVIAIVVDVDEDPQVRSWLIEGLERLAHDELGWHELGRVVSALTAERDSLLRSRLATLVGELPWRTTSLAIVEPLLLDDNRETVSTAASVLARHPDAAARVDPAIMERLRTSQVSGLRFSAKILDEAVRRTQSGPAGSDV